MLSVHIEHMPSDTSHLFGLLQSRQDDSREGKPNSGLVYAPNPPQPPKLQVNKYTGRPFTDRFWKILEKRKALPVWEYYSQFTELVSKHQCVVLVGETGSGKTTQVGHAVFNIHVWCRICVLLCAWLTCTLG